MELAEQNSTLAEMVKQLLAKMTTQHGMENHQKESERTLKAALDGITNGTKLTTMNWYSWEQDVQMNLSCVPYAFNILEAKLLPGNDGYSEALDGRLLVTIKSAMQLDGQSGIRPYLIQAKGSSAWTAGSLFQHLKKVLTRDDEFYLAKVHQRVAGLKMFGNDVRKLCHELDEVWAHTLALGKDLGSDYKLSTLRAKVATNYVYQNTFSNMEDNGNAGDYVKVSQILMAKQEDLDSRPSLRVARVAQVGKPEHEAYWKGRRDPSRPGEPAKCYTCGQEGHIARKSTTQANVPANPHPSG